MNGDGGSFVRSVRVSGLCPTCEGPLIRDSRKRGSFGESWQGAVVEYHCTRCSRTWREQNLALLSQPPRLVP